MFCYRLCQAHSSSLIFPHNSYTQLLHTISIHIPGGAYANVHSLDDLKNMGWTSAKPLRVVTGYYGVARRFFEEQGFDHVVLLSADGALEAAPAMGSADIILDLVRYGPVVVTWWYNA